MKKCSLFARALMAGAAIIAVTSSIALAGGGRWTLIGWNNLGMHCMDDDYSVFSILPPYNTIDAQLITPGGRLVNYPGRIAVSYQATQDPFGSINRTSKNKTNFWSYSLPLFGASLPVDVGLAGNLMPGIMNKPKWTTWSGTEDWFEALGIPLTPIDDRGRGNAYPMMLLTARNTRNNTILARTRIVLPVSSEMTCRACHASTSGTAAKPAAGWVNAPNASRDYRLNILRLHDEKQAANSVYAAALAAKGYRSTGLFDTVTLDLKPVLCAACHASEALPGTGYAGVEPLTQAMHSLHATVINPANGLQMDAIDNRSACYQCHPGAVTRCLRGVMGSAVAADGSALMQCQSCHGSMSLVGSASRTGWLDEPNCQACHTGDAASNSGQIRYTDAFDAPGHLRVAVNTRFATNPNTPAAGKSLYRFSSGHGGLKCEACHGSTHAEFPSLQRNDNLQSVSLQGHTGMLIECVACHPTTPATVTGGPHGMHPVGQAWIQMHQDVADNNSASCTVCHGTDYRGTVLSTTKTARLFTVENGVVPLPAKTIVGCYTCHNGPNGGG